MKQKIDRCWRAYKKHWSVAAPDYGKNPFREGARDRNRQRFEGYVCTQLKCAVRFEWQEDGGVIVAGVIAFSLT
jgi:hypothetical protein